jgi:hypothetical protein
VKKLLEEAERFGLEIVTLPFDPKHKAIYTVCGFVPCCLILNILNMIWKTDRNGDVGRNGKYCKTLVEPELVIGRGDGKMLVQHLKK